MNNQLAAADSLLLYCRPGFEKETAAEIQALAAEAGRDGYAKTAPGSGYVLFYPHDPAAAILLWQALRFDQLIFPRQLIAARPLLTGLPTDDRITPLLQAAREMSDRYRKIFLETADTNEAKELSVFVRKFTAPFERACRNAGLMRQTTGVHLHLFFLDSASVYLGMSQPDNASPWAMGIPRLKFPRGAPSRSTLKLEEAFLHFLGSETPDLQPAMTAVDLGAAPGGWTWQLVRRSIRVTAVDNGPLDQDLLDSGIVQHLRTDGFRYRPPKPVDWLVCDMVEQPARSAELVALWLAEGHCRQAIFNLKLPMKKRYDEVLRCRALIEDKLNQADLHYRLRFKQLYHDREEVTGYCRIGRDR